MKKEWLVPAVIVAVAALSAFAAKANAASKYSKMQYTPPESAEVSDAEKVRSMNDCMSFSANHVSKGHAADREMFSRQFGKTTASQGAVQTYSYDNYTNILLDCSRSLCSCRCLSK